MSGLSISMKDPDNVEKGVRVEVSHRCSGVEARDHGDTTAAPEACTQKIRCISVLIGPSLESGPCCG